MATNEKIVAAVDIGTTKIVSLVGRLNELGKLEILGISQTASKGVKRGVVLNIEETVNAIQTTTSDAIEQSGIKFNEVFVGIAGQHIKSVRNRGYINRDSYDDEITKEDVQHLIDDMYKIPVDVGEEIIHVLPQSYIVDNETGVKNPVGVYGKRLEANFHIVIGQISSARNIEKCINRVGLDVKQLVLEPLASSAAVLTDDDFSPGVFAENVRHLGSGVEQGDPKTQGFENRGQSPADMPPPEQHETALPLHVLVEQGNLPAAFHSDLLKIIGFQPIFSG